MLDSSRRLRVDDRRPLFPLHNPCGPPGGDAVPIPAGIEQSGDTGDPPAVVSCDSVDRPSAIQRESSQIVFFGSDERVSGGIAIALLAMGVDAHVLPAGIAIPAQKPNSEDDHA
jgi:hypothetical protein